MTVIVVTNANAAILAVGTHAAVQNIHALPNSAQTIAPRVLPFNLAPLDTSAVSKVIAVSVIHSSNYTYAHYPQMAGSNCTMWTPRLPNPASEIATIRCQISRRPGRKRSTSGSKATRFPTFV
jgi:hypothetical protein